MPERPNSQSFYWNYNFIPFSERKGYTAVKKCLKFVRMSKPISEQHSESNRNSLLFVF